MVVSIVYKIVPIDVSSLSNHYASSLSNNSFSKPSLSKDIESSEQQSRTEIVQIHDTHFSNTRSINGLIFFCSFIGCVLSIVLMVAVFRTGGGHSSIGKISGNNTQ
jgi:hypothetical protein